MALLGAYHEATGSAVALSTLVPSTVKSIDIRANTANAESVFLGGADVAADGVGAWIELSPGDPWGLSAEEGEQLSLELANIYLIGTASDKVHIAYTQ